MSDDLNILKVNIYGTEYSIRGSTDKEYIKRVAKYVDSKMREVNNTISIDSSLKIAILAALNIADELFNEREQSDQRKSNSTNSLLFDRISTLNKNLDDCLNKYNL